MECLYTIKKLHVSTVWWKWPRKIWRVHPMRHCDVIALVSHCKPMEICIQHRFCIYVASIFQNGLLVWELLFGLLDNSLYVLCNNYNIVIGYCYLNCLEFRANLYNDWLASFGGTWHVELTPCEHYWVREMVNIFLFFNFDETRYFNEDICFNWDFTSLHPMLSYTFLHVLLQFGILYVPIYIQCDNRCFILLGRFFIYPIFFCIFNYAIFIP